MSKQFPPSSRYHDVPERSRTTADGTLELHLARRIIPALDRYRAFDRHRNTGDERIDAVAAASFGDPELYWRICDANGDAEPAEATQTAGRLLVIPLPLEIADDGKP